MGYFYCRNCGTNSGWGIPNVPANLTGNSYQLDKYLKHNYPTANYGSNSTFDDPHSYYAYAVSASANGFYELDGKNRVNWVWDAEKRVGKTTDISGSARPDSAVKYPVFNNPSKIHGFSTALPNAIRCSNCGCELT